MELTWNEIKAPRLILRTKEQIALEGNIPSERRVAELIDYPAAAYVDSVRTEAGRLNIDGRIVVSVTAFGPDGDLFTFASESAFSHSVSEPAIESGMAARALPSVALLSVRQTTDGKLLLTAAVDLDIIVTSSEAIRVLDGVRGSGDLELKTRESELSSRTELGSAVIRLSDEIASSGAESVLSSSIELSVRDTSFENGGVTVSGIANVNALCRGEDGSLIQLTRSIPFREGVQTDGIADEVYASAALKASSVRALGTEFSLISVEAEVELHVFALRKSRLVLPLDAFSPSISFTCLRQKAELLSFLGGAAVSHTVRENVTVPDGMDDIFTPLYASSRPVAANVSVSGGELRIDGLLPTRLIYRSGGGEVHAFSEDVPFSLRMAAPTGTGFAFVELSSVCSVTGGSGRTAQLTYAVDASAEFCRSESAELVVGLAEQDPRGAKECASAVPEGFTGIIVHSAGRNETVFDIAKRYRVSSARVRELNPDCPERFSEGAKLLLVI